MKIISMPHKVSDYTCPINGIEDQYEWKTGQRFPDFLLFYLTTIGFTYVKQRLAPVPRMVFWGNGMGKPQHEFLADIMGYSWTVSENKAFSTALKSVKQTVDHDTPLILGILDMYHLPYYEKFYHRVHIPQHYVQMVGYDDDKSLIYVLDNSKRDVQILPYADLKEAWNIDVPGQGKKNTYFMLSFRENIASIPEIIRQGLKKRADWVLNPAVGFMGIKGMRKMAHEFPGWRNELTPEQFMNCLTHLVTFDCSIVPLLPARMMPTAAQVNDSHQAMRDRFSRCLIDLAAEYRRPEWKSAGILLKSIGERIAKINEFTTDFLMDEKDQLDCIPDIMNAIADEEEQAFRLLLS